MKAHAPQSVTPYDVQYAANSIKNCADLPDWVREHPEDAACYADHLEACAARVRELLNTRPKNKKVTIAAKVRYSGALASQVRWDIFTGHESVSHLEEELEELGHEMLAARLLETKQEKS